MIKGVLLAALLLFLNTSIMPQSRLTRATLRTALVASLMAAGYYGKRAHDLYRSRRGLQISGLRSFRSGPLFLDGPALKLLGGAGVSLLAAALSFRGLSATHGQQERPVTIAKDSVSRPGAEGMPEQLCIHVSESVAPAMSESVIRTVTVRIKPEDSFSILQESSVGVDGVIAPQMSEVGVQAATEDQALSDRRNELSLESGGKVAIAPCERRPISQLDVSTLSVEILPAERQKGADLDLCALDEVSIGAVVMTPELTANLTVEAGPSMGVEVEADRLFSPAASCGTSMSISEFLTSPLYAVCFRGFDESSEKKSCEKALPPAAGSIAKKRLKPDYCAWTQCSAQVLECMHHGDEPSKEVSTVFLAFATDSYRAGQVLEWLNKEMDAVLKFPFRDIDRCRLLKDVIGAVLLSEDFWALLGNECSSAKKQLDNCIKRVDGMLEEQGSADGLWCKLNALAIQLEEGVRLAAVKSELLECWDRCFESDSEILLTPNSKAKIRRKCSGRETLYEAFKGVDTVLSDVALSRSSSLDVAFIQDYLEISARYSLCSQATYSEQ
ncbi:MAG: hypothetical protein QG632_642 [Candidatus Dependentiae bacterium]|nr:hypothetical protein [Candidatus Dependentiae bacterium]